MVTVSYVVGGCGAMYRIIIDGEIFKGKRTIEQHRIVNEVGILLLLLLLLY